MIRGVPRTSYYANFRPWRICGSLDSPPKAFNGSSKHPPSNYRRLVKKRFEIMKNKSPRNSQIPSLPEGQSIVLVGLMGAGKSSVGRYLARALDLPFVDADPEIEAAAGCSVSDIFKLYGEKAFRDGERKVIARLLSDGPQVLATGGGAFMEPETREVIAEKSISIWLKADLDVLFNRTTGRTHRPLLNEGNSKDTLKRLMAERYPIYAEASLTVETKDERTQVTVKRVIKALSRWLEEQGMAA